MLDQPQQEQSIRRANRSSGWFVVLREVQPDGAIHLSYADGAVAVIAPDGSFHWEGAERR